MIFFFAENFNFKVSDTWIDMIYESSKQFTKEDIDHARNVILNITQEEWNSKYGYSGKPAIQDWVNFFRKRKIDENKRMEEERFMKAVRKVEHMKCLAIKQGINISVIEKEQQPLLT